MQAITCENLAKKQKGLSIDNLNFQIPKGYVTGLIGPNGSGKTTIIKMLMDLIPINAGTIRLFGQSHTDVSVKQRIGFVYDDLYMYEHFTIRKMKAVVAPFYQTWNQSIFEQYVKDFDLPLDRKIKHFSKGMKMKCALLFALAHEPDLLIMDEPTAGLDPIFRRELLEIFQTFMLSGEHTILFSTHITTDLDKIADHIIFIHEGQLILQKDMEAIRESLFVVKGPRSLIDPDITALFTGLKETPVGFHGLFEGDIHLFADIQDSVVIEPASLEDVMYYMKREEMQK